MKRNNLLLVALLALTACNSAAKQSDEDNNKQVEIAETKAIVKLPNIKFQTNKTETCEFVDSRAVATRPSVKLFDSHLVFKTKNEFELKDSLLIKKDCELNRVDTFVINSFASYEDIIFTDGGTKKILSLKGHNSQFPKYSTNITITDIMFKDKKKKVVKILTLDNNEECWDMEIFID